MGRRVKSVEMEAMPEWIQEVVDGIGSDVRGTEAVELRRVVGSSNELVELGFDEDRVLMLKRGRHDWVQGMFDTAREASQLLQTETDFAVPRPIPVRSRLSDPLQAYWRIQLPTLGTLWPQLPETGRADALRSLGRLIRRLHQVKLDGWGGLLRLEKGERGLERYLHRDLGERLMPAVLGTWSGGVRPLEGLIDTIAAVAARVEGDRGTLSHSDMHLQNVLCRTTDDGVTCVGLLDLDNCRSLPPEADLASFQTLHGPLFNQELPTPLHQAIAEGYGAALDPVLLTFFRASHLVNLGFHSALVGDDIHAGWVADALEDEVRRLHLELGRAPAPQG